MTIIKEEMTKIHKEIYNICESYILDIQNYYSATFQRIYNAITKVFYNKILPDDKLQILLKESSNVLKSLDFPNNKENRIKEIFSHNNINIEDYFIENPKTYENIVDYK